MQCLNVNLKAYSMEKRNGLSMPKSASYDETKPYRHSATYCSISDASLGREADFGS